MSRYITILLLATCLILAVGCEDRGTNISHEPVDGWTFWPSADHVFTPEMTFQIRNQTELMLGATFIPEAAINGDPVPLLILLAPEGEGKLYYFNHGLETLAQSMIEKGEIEPMVIHCVANDAVFGGYFYSSPHQFFIENNVEDSPDGYSGPTGAYDEIIGGKLVSWLTDFAVPSLIDQPSKRGIGGLGQGAYGAFRAAIVHEDQFGSVSAIDGPLDFDGAGSDGLMDLFDDVIAEQQAWYAAHDVSGLPFDFIRDFDSSTTMPISMMFIGGGIAFSPNDTALDASREFDHGTSIGDPLDDTYVKQIDARYPIADSTTLVLGVIGSDDDGMGFDFNLPFDGTGTVYQPMWDMWMANNLEDMHEDAGSQPLDGVSMWIATNPDAKWGYHEMTQSWIDFLQSQGYAPQIYQFGGGNTIDDDAALYDVMRELLMFHDRAFRD